MNKIELKAIRDLLGMNFYIPNYQRGYRWKKQQVVDLLNDIEEFRISNSDVKDSFYCLQPLVVKESILPGERNEFCKKFQELQESRDMLSDIKNILHKHVQWEVIDGQQRLTTLYILLSILKENGLYHISYETREDSKVFLEKIGEKNEKSERPNIDYYYMLQTKDIINEWFVNRRIDKDLFLSVILDKVKFIWYELNDENPISVFTRLNIGKINLTNSELIKALFLNRSNFPNAIYPDVRLKQQEIAGQWDMIEYSLQNDEFWLFLHDKDYTKPTRIDFVFDILYKQNVFGINKNQNDKDDPYKTFHYFYEYFKSEVNLPDINKCWNKVMDVFQTLQEWYNDLSLYHYIGYLVAINKNKVLDLLNDWKESTDKESFISHVKENIRKNMNSDISWEKVYDGTGSNDKTACKPILLLYNIQTIINQNNFYQSKENYQLGTSYKFPFHLYKLEKWDVEHIDSNTMNDLSNLVQKKEWLRACYLGIDDDNLKEKIKEYMNYSQKNSVKEQPDSEFDNLYKEIAENKGDELSYEEKNQIWNFTLLDASTNRSYGNAIFASKRRCIIGKDQGIRYKVKDNLEMECEEGAIAFIPPCTRNVFLKYYNPLTNSLISWDRKDAESYRDNMKEVLKDFLR